MKSILFLALHLHILMISCGTVEEKKHLSQPVQEPVQEHNMHSIESINDTIWLVTIHGVKFHWGHKCCPIVPNDPLTKRNRETISPQQWRLIVDLMDDECLTKVNVPCDSTYMRYGDFAIDLVVVLYDIPHNVIYEEGVYFDSAQSGCPFSGEYEYTQANRKAIKHRIKKYFEEKKWKVPFKPVNNYPCI